MEKETLSNDHLYIDSFSAILDQCLCLKQTDELLVIFDESLDPFFQALLSCICQRSLSATFIRLPRSYQMALINQSRATHEHAAFPLPAGITAALSGSTAILNILTGTDTASVRRAIIQQSRPANCRLAHIPGINAEILTVVARSPVAEILRSCELLAWALGEARQVELLTPDTGGATHRLGLALEGWDNEPMMSPGVIFPGTWGNVPPGETFCCPEASSVNGAVCINGSVPGHVIAGGQEVILHFRRGRLTHWDGNAQSPAYRFLEDERGSAEARGDTNWNTFAELGVGLNPAVAALTGNSLFDEKAINTVHVAIGDNSVFGHNVKSDVHHDLVTCGASLRLDGTAIMEKGSLELRRIDEARQTPTSQEPIPQDAVISLNEAKVFNEQGVLRRRLHTGYRVGYVSMAADHKLGRLLNMVGEELLTFGKVHIASFLKTHPTFEDTPTMELLAILHHYRALQVSRA